MRPQGLAAPDLADLLPRAVYQDVLPISEHRNAPLCSFEFCTAVQLYAVPATSPGIDYYTRPENSLLTAKRFTGSLEPKV